MEYKWSIYMEYIYIYMEKYTIYRVWYSPQFQASPGSPEVPLSIREPLYCVRKPAGPTHLGR